LEEGGGEEVGLFCFPSGTARRRGCQGKRRAWGFGLQKNVSSWWYGREKKQ